MKNAQVLRVVPDHLKTKRICNHAVKKLSSIIRSFPDHSELNKCVMKLC